MRRPLIFFFCITNSIAIAQVKPPPVIIGLGHIPIAVSTLDSAVVLYQMARKVLTQAGFPVSISQSANGKSIMLPPHLTGGLWLELCHGK